MLFAIVFVSISARGQTTTLTATWNGGTGNWGSAGSWSGGVVPNNSGTTVFNVTVDGKSGTSSLVQISSFFPVITVQNLTINAGDNVSMLSNTTLTVGNLSNSGTLSLSSTSTLLFDPRYDNVFGSGTILLGGGTIGASDGSRWGNAGANAIIGYGTFTNFNANYGKLTSNVAGKTMWINGNASVYNSGTIAASGGNIYFASGTVNNSGTLTATGGSQLSFSSSAALVNNASGKVIADGGTVNIFNPFALSRDDEFSSLNGGGIYFDTLTTAGHTLSGAATGTFNIGTLNNNGGTISSAGSVFLGNTTNVGGKILLNSGTGVINAIINNTGGTFSVGSNGAFLLDNYNTLTGGTFTSTGGGVLAVQGAYNYSGGTIRDLTNNGTINLNNNSNIAGTIDGNGTLNFNSGNEFFALGTNTLGGTGTTNLIRCTADVVYSSLSGSTMTLINDANHTITGVGNFCSSNGVTSKTLINRGLIQASSGGTNYSLLIGGRHFSNEATGTLRTLASSQMIINCDDFNSVGTIDVQAGGTFILYANSTGGTASLSRVVNAGTFSLAQYNSSIGSISGGTLVVNDANVFSVDAMNVNYFSSSGTTSLVAGAGKDAVRAKTFTTPTLDMNDRALVVDYDGASPLTNLTNKLKAGSANNWAAKANAFYSSAAAADPSHHAIGIGEVSAIFSGSAPPTFLGQPVDATTVAARYTFLGDTNLDGRVDIVDLGILASHWQQSGPWTSGDFNYDGTVDIVDLGALATNWQAGTTGSGLSFADAMASVGLGNASVPEPTTMLPVAFGLVALVRRRS